MDRLWANAKDSTLSISKSCRELHRDEENGKREKNDKIWDIEKNYVQMIIQVTFSRHSMSMKRFIPQSYHQLYRKGKIHFNLWLYMVKIKSEHWDDFASQNIASVWWWGVSQAFHKFLNQLLPLSRASWLAEERSIRIQFDRLTLETQSIKAPFQHQAKSLSSSRLWLSFSDLYSIVCHHASFIRFSYPLHCFLC